jgi:UDP-N-acetyl-D-mannosaminuronate dehydrogenase
VDPYYSDEEIVSLGLSPCADFDSVEAIILHTDHPEFRRYSAADFPRLKCVVDGRNFLEPKDWGAATFISLGKP